MDIGTALRDELGAVDPLYIRPEARKSRRGGHSQSSSFEKAVAPSRSCHVPSLARCKRCDRCSFNDGNQQNS